MCLPDCRPWPFLPPVPLPACLPLCRRACQVDRGDTLPLGLPQLMGATYTEGQLKDEMVQGERGNRESCGQKFACSYSLHSSSAVLIILEATSDFCDDSSSNFNAISTFFTLRIADISCSPTLWIGPCTETQGEGGPQRAKFWRFDEKSFSEGSRV